METKETLLAKCNEFVQKRLQNIQKTISDNQSALASETKSSAGDKHETGRAMLQLEMEKASEQWADIQQMKETLNRIEVAKVSQNVHLGSIVTTSIGNYFLAISAGKLAAFGEDYFAISASSPIGKLLLGKQEKDIVVFNGKRIEILQVF